MAIGAAGLSARAKVMVGGLLVATIFLAVLLFIARSPTFSLRALLIVVTVAALCSPAIKPLMEWLKTLDKSAPPSGSSYSTGPAAPAPMTDPAPEPLPYSVFERPDQN